LQQELDFGVLCAGNRLYHVAKIQRISGLREFFRNFL
jgi:hypothetical protein